MAIQDKQVRCDYLVIIDHTRNSRDLGTTVSGPFPPRLLITYDIMFRNLKWKCVPFHEIFR